MPNNYPVRNQHYSFEQIQSLILDDTPHLMFEHQRTSCVIQDSHCTTEQLMAVPGFAQLVWRYEYTTEEWIPVFKAVDVSAVLQCVDIEDCLAEPGCLWVTPKGLPREQYKPDDILGYNNEVGDVDTTPTLRELDEMRREEDE